MTRANCKAPGGSAAGPANGAPRCGGFDKPQPWFYFGNRDFGHESQFGASLSKES
jgi:hypothetical protein